MQRAVLAGVVFWAGLASAPGGPTAQPCDTALLARAQAAYQALAGFQGRFKQEDRESDGRLLTAEGKIAYHRPGRMRWEYAPPNEQLLVTDGVTVWLYDPLLENVTVQPLEGLTEGTPLKFLLGVGNLMSDFTCRPATLPPPADGLIYLELVAKKEIPTLAFIQLGVRSGTAALESFRMIDTRGNQRTVRLLELKQTVAFPPDHFRFTIPPGMEVIRK
jgi:outer membrane lipoprotein carrier protein